MSEKSAKPMHHPPTHALDRIVMPVSGSDREFLAQLTAVQLAAELRVPVTAVHVGDTDDDEVFAYARKECDEWNVELDSVHLGGDVVETLLSELGPRDLIVIGTRRLGHDGWHVGSVTLALIQRAPCPVQVVRLD